MAEPFQYTPGSLSVTTEGTLNNNALRMMRVNVGSPQRVNLGQCDACIVAAFTPTATTCTLAIADGTSNVLITSGLTLRVSGVIGNSINPYTGFHVRLWSRRKPGTSGAMALQTITLKGGLAGANTIARVNMNSSGIGADPAPAVLDLPCPAGDDWHTFNEGEPVTITISTVDPDLELVYEAYGFQD